MGVFVYTEREPNMSALLLTQLVTDWLQNGHPLSSSQRCCRSRVTHFLVHTRPPPGASERTAPSHHSASWRGRGDRYVHTPRYPSHYTPPHYACPWIRLCLCMPVHAPLYFYTCICLYAYVVCVFLCIYIRIHTCMFVYTSHNRCLHISPTL